MRCPSCGTDNTADSRFCGGCGAKASASRVAPTVKLADDAKFPASIPPGAYVAPQPIPPNNVGRTPIHIPTPPPGSLNYGQHQSYPPTDPGHTPSISPTNPGTQQRPSLAHRAQSQPPVAASRRSVPEMSSPSLSMAAAPRRNSTLIAVIVILDLGLAGAGAMLLAKGMSKPAVKAPASSTRVDPPKPTPNSGATVTPIETGSAAGSASAAPEPKPVSSAVAPGGTGSASVAVDAKKAKDTKHHSTKGGSAKKLDAATGTGSAPLDPYAAAPSSVAADVNAKAAGSSGVFLLCHNTAGEVHGTIQIAFQVLPDGHVSHVSAVENTTGSGQLASCLANTISSWTFPPHTGDATEFVRPFKYD